MGERRERQSESFLTGPVFPRFLNINEMLPYAFNETGKGSSPKTGSID